MSASVPMSPSWLKSALLVHGAAGQFPPRHVKNDSMSASVPTSPSQLKSGLSHWGSQTSGCPLLLLSAQVVPGPAQDPPEPVQVALLVMKQNPLLEQQAPSGWGQLAPAQVEELPRYVPPAFAHAAADTLGVHEPFGMQQAPTGQVLLVPHATPAP